MLRVWGTMAYDDLTLRKFRALTDIVLGVDNTHARGTILEATADAGAILIQAGLVEAVVDDVKKSKPAHGYNRRDQQASREIDAPRTT